MSYSAARPLPIAPGWEAVFEFYRPARDEDPAAHEPLRVLPVVGAIVNDVGGPLLVLNPEDGYVTSVHKVFNQEARHAGSPVYRYAGARVAAS
jgi:hypothetical protein